MVSLQKETLRGSGVLFSGPTRVSEVKYEIHCFDENGITRAFGWFELKESLWERLDISKAELKLSNGKSLKLDIDNPPSASRIEFNVDDAYIGYLS